ncbi:MAG: formyltetrahydrofolate deformylase [Candidatus Hydrogenedentota bacterium]
MDTVILLVACPDQHGIVAKLTQCIAELDGNIVDSHQYSTDSDSGQFFMRLEFCFEDSPDEDAIRAKFAPLADSLSADWQLYFTAQRPRMAIAVSKFDHCLVDILYHHRVGDLAVEIPLVISNHDDLRPLVEAAGIPFHHISVSKETKVEAEAEIVDLIKDTSDFLVLARYMQILTGDFLKNYGKPVINIHHSFLPSFKGANPYQQAHDRGVKLIGATAHYVTTDLDEGPIIEQAVGHVTHRDTPHDLRRIGRSLEQQSLGRAIQQHVNHRIIRHHHKTIIFE